jgi:ArsR family transcriptional regulator
MAVNMMAMTMREIAVIDQRCCTPLAEAPLSEADAERLASALRIVADPARLRLLSLIAAAGEGCVCDLTEPLGLSQPTVSHHLRVLTDAGLLVREKRGRWAFFRVQPDGLELLRDALSPTPFARAAVGGSRS